MALPLTNDEDAKLSVKAVDCSAIHPQWKMYGPTTGVSGNPKNFGMKMKGKKVKVVFI